MHEERIRKWSKQEKKMPDGGVTAMEEEIKVFFWGGGGCWDISIVQKCQLVPNTIKSSANKKNPQASVKAPLLLQ